MLRLFATFIFALFVSPVLANAAQALSRIIEHDSPFIISSKGATHYLTQVLLEQANKTNALTQHQTPNNSPLANIELAEKQQAYFTWGAIPFLNYAYNNHTDLTIHVHQDPLLQRVMCSSIIKPKRDNLVQYQLAHQFQNYLLLPSTQAKISSYISSLSPLPLWAAAGRHN